MAILFLIGIMSQQIALKYKFIICNVKTSIHIGNKLISKPSRLGFKFPLINSAFWGIVSTFKIQGSVFFDQGKIWSDMMPFKNVKYRKYRRKIL